ncbi:hypothetical protein ASG01_05060 [Chryseobacterium sp. Leaf180]|uniref:hypothetical protein n=1 Tax=Chryseobacterium sp. Leaf180 TaxID=1736289 RepID=UPI0006F6AA51|nr:hypothetical protein [Chryseobacterium sp. Leaf180]KQR95220.1 hypothetical protein ASG01_05060 [Chryseobacterium sp. Leaf180]
MKKLVVSFALICLGTFSNAQTSYEKVMTEKIAKVQSTEKTEEFQALANDFGRIADKEKDKWQPQYYAALAYIQKGRMLMREGKMDDLDAIADQAQKFVDVAESVEKNNSEIKLLQKMIYSLRMMVNPMERFMTMGMKAQQELAAAEKLNPENPRVTLIKAEDTYYTPEQYGGSKEEGKKLFAKAMEQFKTFKPKNALDPTWGKGEADFMMANIK